MKISNKWLREAETLCAELGPDDGIDPCTLLRGRSRKHKQHKTLQLCKKAKRVISLVLAGEMNDPLLQALQVIEVHAESDDQFLRIEVGHSDPLDTSSEGQVLSALQQAQGYLRSVVAQSVKRKRISALRFTVAEIPERGQ